MKVSSFRYLLKEGLKNIWGNRLMSLASLGILVACLVLTGSAFLFSMNVSSALDSIEKKNSVTVYLDTEVSSLDAVKLGEKIKNVPNVKDCEFYSKEEAMEQYVDVLGDLFNGLQGEENPLPDAYHISMYDLSLYDQTVQSIEQIDGVDSVSDRSDAASKLTKLNNLVTVAGFWIVLILGSISLFIISNTISVTMYSRRLEISIMKSVGATDGFIRIPFMVEGIFIGVISALFSTLFLSILYETLIMAARQIIPFTHIPFSDVVWQISLVFLIAAVMFGAVGSIISIQKYLKKNGGSIIGI